MINASIGDERPYLALATGARALGLNRCLALASTHGLAGELDLAGLQGQWSRLIEPLRAACNSTHVLQAIAAEGLPPAGPWFVPSWNVSDPGALRLWLRLNGALMQNGCTDDMVFGIAEQIAYLSRHVALLPGDLICTGSPAGFGSHHGRFLHPGDVVEAGIDGLGAQRICFIEGSPSSHRRY